MELFKGLVLGQYVPVDSAVHRLDPRTKILAALGLLGVIFAIRGFAGLAVLTAVLAAATLVARIRPGYVVRGVRPLLWLLVFAFALQVVFGEEGGHPLARGGEHRTRMRELRLRPRDYTALFLVAAAAALALVSPAVWRGR